MRLNDDACDRLALVRQFTLEMLILLSVSLSLFWMNFVSRRRQRVCTIVNYICSAIVTDKKGITRFRQL